MVESKGLEEEKEKVKEKKGEREREREQKGGTDMLPIYHYISITFL